MKYATLIIDYEELIDVKNGLDFVLEELTNIKNIVGQIQSMIGNPKPDLAGAVSSFESSWDDNRGDLTDTAKSMSDAVGTLLEGWNKWDSDTASAVNGDGQGPQVTTSTRTTGGPV